jgi:predicted dehydrogenase
LNLLNWFFGAPQSVGGTSLNKIFSNETEDEVYGTLFFPGGKSAQLSVNWSDESYRKMSTKMTIWGKSGRMVADRQEIQVYLRDDAPIPAEYKAGWNVRYTTELTKPVWFYVRGEEYSAQLDYFVSCIKAGQSDNINSFESAAVTDNVIAMLIADANSSNRTDRASSAVVSGVKKAKAPWYSFASR